MLLPRGSPLSLLCDSLHPSISVLCWLRSGLVSVGICWLDSASLFYICWLTTSRAGGACRSKIFPVNLLGVVPISGALGFATNGEAYALC